jgi:RHS repeat-associated protein
LRLAPPRNRWISDWPTAGFTYDALGRQLTQTIPVASISNPTFTSEYDLAGRRTKLTWPVDASSSTAYYANYDYLVTGEVEKVREKGATSGAGVLAVYGYDDLGRRTSITRGNGATTGYGYDAVSRLTSLSHDFSGTTQDLTLTFAYNPASQIVSTTRSNDLYAWDKHGSGTTSSSANGRNQLSSHAGATPTYDARGNLTNDGSVAYTYSSENLLTSTGTSGTLEYDPLMRFYKNYTQYFIHEAGSGQLLGEYYLGNIAARYVPGAAEDEPVGEIWKTGTRHYYHADERGSVIALGNDAGANEYILRFDEYGKRGTGGSFRFAYTGQNHLINDIYDFKNRNYNARLGRFLQADPIGYAGGMNLYAYVKGDPINSVDPLGLCAAGEIRAKDTTGQSATGEGGDIVIQGHYKCLRMPSAASNGSTSPSRGAGQGPIRPTKKMMICVGRSYVLGGNPANIGQEGFPDTTVTKNSAAVATRQWTGADTGGPFMRAIGQDVVGIVFYKNDLTTFQSFTGVTQNIGNNRIGSARAAQIAIMARAPGQLVLELVSGDDWGRDNLTILVIPDMGQGCPEGTS